MSIEIHSFPPFIGVIKKISGNNLILSIALIDGKIKKNYPILLTNLSIRDANLEDIAVFNQEIVNITINNG